MLDKYSPTQHLCLLRTSCNAICFHLLVLHHAEMRQDEMMKWLNESYYMASCHQGSLGYSLHPASIICINIISCPVRHLTTPMNLELLGTRLHGLILAHVCLGFFTMAPYYLHSQSNKPAIVTRLWISSVPSVRYPKWYFFCIRNMWRLWMALFQLGITHSRRISLVGHLFSNLSVHQKM